MIDLYVDILLIVNLAVNDILLLSTARLIRRPARKLRIYLAAALGAVSCLIIFLPPVGLFWQLAYKIGVCFLMVRIAFPWEGAGAFWEEFFVMFVVSFLFAGLCSWVSATFRTLGIYANNTVVYFHISPLLLILMTTAVYALIWLYDRLRRGQIPQESLCSATASYHGRQKTFTALIDTGNSLHEPFSGRPVAVCGCGDASPLVESQLLEALDTLTPQAAVEHQIRMVPYHGVGHAGVLPAVHLDQLSIHAGTQAFTVPDVYLALDRKKLAGSRYQMILGRELFEIKG